jgi:hypothetical protein
MTRKISERGENSLSLTKGRLEQNDIQFGIESEMSDVNLATTDFY